MQAMFTKTPSKEWGVKIVGGTANRGDTVTVIKRNGGSVDVIVGELVRRTNTGDSIYKIDDSPRLRKERGEEGSIAPPSEDGSIRLEIAVSESSIRALRCLALGSADFTDLEEIAPLIKAAMVKAGLEL